MLEHKIMGKIEGRSIEGSVKIKLLQLFQKSKHELMKGNLVGFPGTFEQSGLHQFQ
jgi:hypothetical protein